MVWLMRRIQFLALVLAMGAAVAMLGSDPRAFAQPASNAQTVVELFTSQGCSSCPPADALLKKLSARPDIIALSLHINYWDYIGWKDPFASKDTTDRQHRYAEALRQRFVYTPEMVIDGFADVDGSQEDEVAHLIDKAAKRDRLRLPVTVKSQGAGKLTVSLPGAADTTKATIWLFAYDREHVTAVPNGENGGRSLTNTNVVRELQRLGEWDGKPVELNAQLADAASRDGVAVIVQNAEAGPVIGAAAIALH